MIKEDWRAVPLTTLAELERDAARYRWIREHAGYNLNNDVQIGNFEVSRKTGNGEAWCYYTDELDAAVDIAMAESANAQGEPRS